MRILLTSMAMAATLLIAAPAAAGVIVLKNGKDKMRGREKRLGRQTAVAADVVFPNGWVTAVSAHLDANSTQAHRRDQMRDILNAIGDDAPAVIGGDWNTTTYNSSRAFYAIIRDDTTIE